MTRVKSICSSWCWSSSCLSNEAMTKLARVTTKRIDTPQAAKFFTHAINVNHLNPFVAGEKSLADAARELDISTNRMNYWVNKLQGLDLIYTVRVEKRGRHRVSIYRATADVFVVPVVLLPTDSDEDIFFNSLPSSKR